MTLALKPIAPPVDSGWAHFSRWNQYRCELLAEARQWGLRRNRTGEQERIARTLCAQLVTALWTSRTEPAHRAWVSPWKPGEGALARRIETKSRDAAHALHGLSVVEAAYLVSSLYTTLLPPEIRSSRGAFYTPPALAERLIDLVSGEGIDWFSARVLDPACGGGAFLAPLAHRMLNDHRVQSREPEERLLHLEQRLHGIELDEFAAWMSCVFLQLLVYPTSRDAGRPLRPPIEIADALTMVDSSFYPFDLVIGNPPYGRVSLTLEQRQAFARSLYGHANLYGVFLDLALRWRKTDGLVAFVTPTSFLGGQYFSRLRSLLVSESPPLAIDIVDARSGVFEAVLQETCLAVFGLSPDKTTVVHHLQVSDRAVKVTRAGSFRIDKDSGAPWLIPRSPEQALLVTRLTGLPTRLHDLGYKASTGPLVWNRHKDQLRGSARPGAYPLIWSEAVRRNRFTFDYRARAAVGYVSIKKGQEFLIEQNPVVLVQRTTAKEQDRRLVACAVPDSFLAAWNGLVVENHVNVLRRVGADPVRPEAMAAVLNTRAVDQVFRCISGSVAVSASELHALPLPSRETFVEVSALLESRSKREDNLEAMIESAVAKAYALGGDL